MIRRHYLRPRFLQQNHPNPTALDRLIKHILAFGINRYKIINNNGISFMYIATLTEINNIEPLIRNLEIREYFLYQLWIIFKY